MQLILHLNARFQPKHRFELEDALQEIFQKNNAGEITGGANLVQQLVNEDFIDCYYITVIPTLLGSGIRLFENIKHEVKLRLLHTQSYNGMTDLIYTRYRNIKTEGLDYH